MQAGSLLSRKVARRELIQIVIARGLNGICALFCYWPDKSDGIESGRLSRAMLLQMSVKRCQRSSFGLTIALGDSGRAA